MTHSWIEKEPLAPLVENQIPAQDYTSENFLRLENEKVWPKAWHCACREEDLSKPGDYFVYDFLRESILLVRLKDNSIKAFHNVCRHRGRQLLEGCGHATSIRCRFHGWRWNMDGTIAEVLDREGWKGTLSDEYLHLNEVHTGTWGGFVFVNLAKTPEETLESFLKPVPEMFGHYEFEAMRYERWRTYELDCNWKVFLEAFIEAYHVAGTHPQMLAWIDDRTESFAHGKHAVVTTPRDAGGVRRVRRSLRLGPEQETDPRQLITEFYTRMSADIGATYQARDAEAAQRLMDLPADTPGHEVLAKFVQIRREASEAIGAGWPKATPEQIGKGGLFWHVFPNMVLNTTYNASLWYRSRPHVSDPNKCYADVIFLRRYAPRAEPTVKRVYVTDWRQRDDNGLILEQDLNNVACVQKGMQSSGFEGARPGFVQEQAVINFHRVLREFMLR